MEKIPTLFVRDEQDRRYVTTDVTPGCEWVLAGEGTPTRKYDGTCVMYDGARWWARREVKPGKAAPDGFVALSTDENTGKTVGWEPVEQSAFAKWHAQAIEGIAEQEPGTYELIGPKVNGNPEGEHEHRLVAHALADVMDVPDRSYDGIAKVLAAAPGIEGIVFHHPDGRMVKIKRRDFASSTRITMGHTRSRSPGGRVSDQFATAARWACGTCGADITEADLVATQPGYPNGAWCIPGECRHCHELRGLAMRRRQSHWWRRFTGGRNV